jgi:hypothetical protein
MDMKKAKIFLVEWLNFAGEWEKGWVERLKQAVNNL